jgi:hypothetical protein
MNYLKIISYGVLSMLLTLFDIGIVKQPLKFIAILIVVIIIDNISSTDG